MSNIVKILLIALAAIAVIACCVLAAVLLVDLLDSADEATPTVAVAETGAPFANPIQPFDWSLRSILNALAPYFIIESFLRYGTAVAGQKPMGLLVLELPYWIARRVWRLAGRATGRQTNTIR